MNTHSQHTRAAGPVLVSAAEAYEDAEGAYAVWVHRFVERLSARLPDEPAHRIVASAHAWAHQCHRLSAEDAAEIAAMWWH